MVALQAQPIPRPCCQCSQPAHAWRLPRRLVQHSTLRPAPALPRRPRPAAPPAWPLPCNRVCAPPALAQVLEAHGADREAAAAAVVEQLAACDPAAPAAVAGLVKALGAGALFDYGLLERIRTGLTSEDAMPLDRQAALRAYAALCAEVGRPVEPHLLPLLPTVLERCADRVSGAVAAFACVWGGGGGVW